MERMHPIVNFIYFAVVLGCSMVLMHPLCLMISFVAALCYTIRLFGFRSAKTGLLDMVGIMVVAAVMNPAFSHQGVTTLCYLPSGNALTLESILYGIAAAVMLGATLLWFRCVSEILTADKIVYLLGRPFPILAMVLAMVLGFLPKMQRKLREIQTAQEVREESDHRDIQEGNARSVEHNIGEKTITDSESIQTESYTKIQKKGQALIQKTRRGIENISLLITWALQDGVDMADSMRSRGYGLPGRTAYTTFRFTGWDRMVLVGIILALLYLVVGAYAGGLYWEYYPMTEGVGINAYSVSLYIVYALLCFLPVGIEGLEAYQYHKMEYKLK